MNTNTEKLKAFAALVETEQKANKIAEGLRLFPEKGGYNQSIINDCAVTIKPAAKYTKVDVGSAGKFMVVNETGEIFGIKGYGVIHRGHQYGTLDTIHEWAWGDYYPKAQSPSNNVYWRNLPETATVEETKLGFAVTLPTGDKGVVFWHGHETHEAIAALKVLAGRCLMTIYQDLIAAGVQVANHESDLYCPVTEQTTALLKQHGKTATVFVNQRPPNVGERWYDVPFAFDPWWEARAPKERISG